MRWSDRRSAIIECHFLVFKDNDQNYPICGISENEMAVHTALAVELKRILHSFCMAFRDMCYKISPNGRRRIQYTENCYDHSVPEEFNRALASIKTELRYFSQCNTSRPTLRLLYYPNDKASLEYSAGISQDRNDLRKYAER